MVYGGITANGGGQVLGNRIVAAGISVGAGVLVANNSVAGGGTGIDYSDSSLTGSPTQVINNTISSCGTGVNCNGPHLVLANNIVAFNGTGVATQYVYVPTLDSNCVFGNGAADYSGVAKGANDISVDPKLEDVAHGHLHIQPDSPCINAGDDSVVDASWTDVDGQPRIQGGRVDIGADESDGTTWAPIPPPVVRVSPTGNDTNDGSSWSQAKRTVQAAIRALPLTGGEVWVAAGSYPENVTILPYVYVYGGFSGVETSRQLRDPEKNHSDIVNSQRGGDLVTFLQGYRIDGIDGMQVRGSSYDGVDGGAGLIVNCTIAGCGGYGVMAYEGAPLVARCHIYGNKTAGVSAGPGAEVRNSFVTGNAGSGLNLQGSSSAFNNTIARNAASGIACQGAVLAVNNIVADNGGYGLSYMRDSTGNPAVARFNCVYGNAAGSYNEVDPGAGAISEDPLLAASALGRVHIQPGSPCIGAGDPSVVKAGWADIDGQPMAAGKPVDIGADLSDGTVWSTAPAVCRVAPWGNDSNDGASWSAPKRTIQAGLDSVADAGGEVWVAQGTYSEHLVVPAFAYMYGGFKGTETSRDQRNWASYPTEVTAPSFGEVTQTIGGYLADGVFGFTFTGNGKYGNVVEFGSSSPYFQNNIVRDGYPDTAIHGNACSPLIRGNLVYGNGTAIEIDYSGNPVIVNNTCNGPIVCDTTTATIVNNIIEGGISMSPGAAPVEMHNCVFGSGTNYTNISPSPTDINADPGFVDATAGNYRCAVGSPCIDAGLNQFVTSDYQRDLEGQPRIWDGNGPGIVDIGAYEYAPTQTMVGVWTAPDGSPVSLSEAIVSAVFTGGFYIESDDRAFGMWVSSPNYTPSLPARVHIVGTLHKDQGQGPGWIAATSVTPVGTGTVKPLTMTESTLSASTADPGVSTGGLLVRIAGVVTGLDSPDFTIWDGSTIGGASIRDWYGNPGVHVHEDIPGNEKVPVQKGQWVIVTGISGIDISGTNVTRSILVSQAADIQVLF